MQKTVPISKLILAITNNSKAYITCPSIGKKSKAVAQTQMKVEMVIIFFLAPTPSAIAPKKGEIHATTIAVSDTAQDHHCVPSISVGAIDVVK